MRPRECWSTPGPWTKGDSPMDTARIQQMDRETLDGIHEVAERLTRRIDAIVDPEVRDLYEDAHAALVLVCRETRDR